MVDLLLATGLEEGRSAARRTIASGGAYLNNVKITDEDAIVGSGDVLPGDVLLVRKGRRTLAVGRVDRVGRRV